MIPSAPIVSINNLTKSFISGNSKKQALSQVSFDVEASEIFGLLGPNGAGKTTTLRIIAGVFKGDSGKVDILGKTRNVDDKEMQKEIGFLSAGTQLYPLLNVRETLELFGNLYQFKKNVIKEKIDFFCETFSLKDSLNKKIKTLSSGQKQKVNLARVLMHDPKVLILDEPTTGLDILASAALLDIIANLKKQGKAIIYSTHILSEIEILADKIAIIYDGKIITQGPLQGINESANCQRLSESFLKIIQDYSEAQESAQ